MTTFLVTFLIIQYSDGIKQLLSYTQVCDRGKQVEIITLTRVGLWNYYYCRFHVSRKTLGSGKSWVDIYIYFYNVGSEVPIEKKCQTCRRKTLWKIPNKQ